MFFDNNGYLTLTYIASIFNTSEAALKLLLSLLFGYPLLYIHRTYLLRNPALLQHAFFIICGISLAIFNFGFNVVHSMICIVVAWLVFVVIGGTFYSVVITFIFQMGYLLVAYYVTETESYDIKWTMPHCVLTLRLIALSFDLYDGKKNPEALSADQKMTALAKCPSLIEIASQTYFPASFVVGPQFSLRRYQDFINNKLFPPNTPSPSETGIQRGCYGLFFLIIYQIGIAIIPDSYLISDDFRDIAFWKKMVILGFWGKIVLYKYVSCWLIAEGACIYSGLAYSGMDTKGNPIWKGCANIKLYVYETSDQFTSLIEGFNTNTNAWLAQYVYKRLKFLNNRILSQVGALTFLAVWHGLHSGYYACFFLEFIIVYFEKDLTVLLMKYPDIVSKLTTPPLSHGVYTIKKIYVTVFMGYCLGAFVLLKSYRWWIFYSNCYFIGHIFFGGWLLYKPLVKKILDAIGGHPSSKSHKKQERENKDK